MVITSSRQHLQIVYFLRYSIYGEDIPSLKKKKTHNFQQKVLRLFHDIHFGLASVHSLSFDANNCNKDTKEAMATKTEWDEQKHKIISPQTQLMRGRAANTNS